MKIILKMVVAVGLLIGASGVPASADPITFDLSGVTLSDGGTLTGSFTTNEEITKVLSVDITASAKGAFSEFTYKASYDAPANSSTKLYASVPYQYIRVDASVNGSYQLQISFDNQHPLTAAGAPIYFSSSYDHQPQQGAGNRVVTAGKIVAALAVPEPGSFSVVVSVGALIVTGGAWRRRGRRLATNG